MTSSRLSLALDAGAVALPETGPIAVYRPPAGMDLSGLGDPARLRIAHGFAPDHEWWQATGVATAPGAPTDAVAALVVLPRVRAQAQDLLARAASHGGPVLVDGQKTDGIDAILKALKPRVDLSQAFSKAHGKIAQFTAPAEALADWRLPDISETPSGWWTAPGLFSADGPDPGSLALADALPPLKGRVADLGSGWGLLAAHVLRHPGVTEVALVEAEHAGLAAARANVSDPRARFHWADATRWGTPSSVDHVVTNPPFHTSRAADPALGAAFIASAARLLAPRGTLWLVANRHLPYERALATYFAEVRPLSEGRGYKIVSASGPRSPAAAPRAPRRRT